MPESITPEQVVEADQPAPTGTTTDHEPSGQATLTQDAVNKMVGSARVEARQAFLKKHGFASEDEFSAAVKKAKEIEESQLTELEKANKRLAELEAEASAAKAEAEAMRLTNLRARIGREKGLPEAFVEDIKGTTEDEIAAWVDAKLPFIKTSVEPDDDLGGGTNPTGAADMTGSPNEKMAKLLMHQLTHRSV